MCWMLARNCVSTAIVSIYFNLFNRNEIRTRFSFRLRLPLFTHTSDEWARERTSTEWRVNKMKSTQIPIDLLLKIADKRCYWCAFNEKKAWNLCQLIFIARELSPDPLWLVRHFEGANVWRARRLTSMKSIVLSVIMRLQSNSNWCMQYKMRK